MTQKKYCAGWSADYSALTDVILQTATQNYHVHAAKFDSPLISGIVASSKASSEASSKASSEASSKASSEASSKASSQLPVITLNVSDTIIEAILEFVYLNTLAHVSFRDMLKTLDFIGGVGVFDMYCGHLSSFINDWFSRMTFSANTPYVYHDRSLDNQFPADLCIALLSFPRQLPCVIDMVRCVRKLETTELWILMAQPGWNAVSGSMMVRFMAAVTWLPTDQLLRFSMYPTTKSVQIQCNFTAEDFESLAVNSSKEYQIDEDWVLYAESEFDSGDVVWDINILKRGRGNYTSVEIDHDDFYYAFHTGMVDTFDDQLPVGLITSPQCVTLNVHITEHMAFRI